MNKQINIKNRCIKTSLVGRLRGVFLLLLFISTLSAQTHHDLFVEGMAGYSTFITDNKNINSGVGVGLGVGGGYELTVKKFKLHTGVEFLNSRPVLRMDDFVNDADMIDTENDAYIAHFNFKENKDKYSLGYVNIPLMLGAQFGNFYFLAGGKVGLNIFANSTTSTTITTTASYPAFIDEFGNMPNHFLSTNKEKSDYKPEFDINYSLALEIGTYLKNQGSTRYRVALHCDYGLKDLRKDLKNEDLILAKPEADYYQPILNDFLISNKTKANLLFIGVKFTILFRIDKRPVCHWYM